MAAAIDTLGLQRHPPIPSGKAAPALGLYVHWPFCLAKCPYCDFNSHVRHGDGAIDQARFRDAYLRELGVFAESLGPRPVRSVFFGGGTPSLMAPETVAAILEAVGRRFGLEADAEVTLEANPTSVEAGRFAGYRKAGVNRLSIGIQALNDTDLKALGRQHSAKEALAALEIARAHFDRVSFDLIYGRVGQSEAEWREELATALGFAAGHLSLYQLTIEPGTPFEALYRKGRLKMPSGRRAEALYAITQELTEEAGLPAYEVSNHARPGQESRHNLIYWRAEDYAGIGPGAHSRIWRDGKRIAMAARKLPEAWLSQVEALGHGCESEEALAPEEAADEFLLMGLRLSEGIDLGKLGEIDGRAADPRRIGLLEEDGLIWRQGMRIGATQKGRMVLDRLILELAA